MEHINGQLLNSRNLALFINTIEDKLRSATRCERDIRLLVSPHSPSCFTPKYVGKYSLGFKTTYYGHHKDSGGCSDWSRLRDVKGYVVYQIDAGGEVYVGMSKSVYNRINDHNKKHSRLSLLRHKSWEVDVWSCGCEYTAYAFESLRIRQYGTINGDRGRVNYEWVMQSTGLFDWVLAWMQRNDWHPTLIQPDGNGFRIHAAKKSAAVMGGA